MFPTFKEIAGELPELFGPEDRSKELGIAGIFLYYHALVALMERNPRFQVLPPVLVSTLSVLAGLGLLRGTLGAEVAADIVAYFDPAVQFLGNHMSLWLVPPLVLLPNAVQKIPNTKAVVWIKLIFVHFSLWALSVTGATLLAKLLTANLRAGQGGDVATPRGGGLQTIWRMIRGLIGGGGGGASGDEPLVVAEQATPSTPKTASAETSYHEPNPSNGASPSSSSSSTLISGPTSPFPRDRIRPPDATNTPASSSSSSSSSASASTPWMTIPAIPRPHTNGSATSALSSSSSASNLAALYPPTYLVSARSPLPMDADEAARVLREKQIKLIRFWFAVSAACYAATAAIKTTPRLRLYRGLLSSYTPALASSAVAVFTAGQAMPYYIKKALHPLMLTAVCMGASVLALSRLHEGGPVAAPALAESLEPAATAGWAALHQFTSKARPKDASILADLRAGDFLSLFLGPSCTALAFRIYGTLDKMDAQELVVPLGTSFATALASLLASPALGALAGLPEELNRVLAHRTVTSALAIPAASLTDASPELTTASVLLTGLYGASGAWLYELQGLLSHSDVAAGSVVGATSHTIGTSELVRAQPSAAGVASIAMMSTGLFHAFLCSLPRFRELLQRFASLSPLSSLQD